MTSPSGSSLEHTFAKFLGEVKPARGVQLRTFVLGKPRALDPVIREQLFLIGREAVINALCHSEATKIEVEIQYHGSFSCVSIRDNGCGISPETILRATDSHWGLRGMRARAESIGARFGIWSAPRAGTEVRVAVPVDVTTARA